LLESLLYRNRDREVAGWTGFAGIVCGLWAARGMGWLTEGKLGRDLLCPRGCRDPQAGQKK